MNEFGEYQVTGTRPYRGHQPGDTFEARLEPGPERRAIARGDIRLIRRLQPGLQPGSYELPAEWAAPQTEAPQGASLIAREG